MLIRSVVRAIARTVNDHLEVVEAFAVVVRGEEPPHPIGAVGRLAVREELQEARTAANGTIRERALRSRCGTTIAAVYREEHAIVSPDPDTVLEPGDVLLLLGSREVIAAAMRHLDRLAGTVLD